VKCPSKHDRIVEHLHSGTHATRVGRAHAQLGILPARDPTRSTRKGVLLLHLSTQQLQWLYACAVNLSAGENRQLRYRARVSNA